MIDGLVVVDKPAGWTSHDVVARCRRVFDQRRVGHSGTLDPEATGVLLVGLGRVTRLLRFLTALPKSYVGEVVLGTATSTLDAGGQVVERVDMSATTLDDVRRAAQVLVGEIEQVPPMVSAVKVGGRRLHELARHGVEVEREPRLVTVHRLDLAPAGAPGEPGVYRIDVDCSSGTYVRCLAADLGRALGGVAHLRALRRTGIGSFTLAEAHPLDSVERLGPAAVLSPAQAMRDHPCVAVDDDLARSLAHGQSLDPLVPGLEGEGPWAMVDRGGRLLAVYQPGGRGRAVPAVVLAAR